MNSSQSYRRLTRIQKELSSLELKKKKIINDLASAQKKDNYMRSLQFTLSQNSQKLIQVNKELQLSRVRLGKLSKKLEELQTQKIREVNQLQNESIERQDLVQQAAQIYTPQVSDVERLRLDLIDVENSQELKGISHIFSLRKNIIAFMKKQSYNWSNQPEFGLQIYICQKNLVGQFQMYLMSALQEKKLAQFKMTIKKPISKYFGVLYQVQEAFKRGSQVKRNQIQFNEVKGQSVICQIAKIQSKRKDRFNTMLKIDEKIIRTQQKISKYHQYIQELDFQCESTSQEIEETKRLLHKMVSPSPFLRSLSNELTQITEAIDYLNLKIETTENLNNLNSPKTLTFLHKFQGRFDSPVLLSFES